MNKNAATIIRPADEVTKPFINNPHLVMQPDTRMDDD